MPLFGLSEEGVRRTRAAVETSRGNTSSRPARRRAEPTHAGSAQDRGVYHRVRVAAGWLQEFRCLQIHGRLSGGHPRRRATKQIALDWFNANFTTGDKALLWRPIPSPIWFAMKMATTEMEDKYVAVNSSDTPCLSNRPVRGCYQRRLRP